MQFILYTHNKALISIYSIGNWDLIISQKKLLNKAINPHIKYKIL